MKIILCSLGLLLLAGSLGMAHPRSEDSAVCGFTVQGEPARPAITGPADLVPLVHVVEQPDSPIEIDAVNLEGTWLSVINEQHSAHFCARFRVRNRSDRVVQGFELELSLRTRGGGGGTGALSEAPLAPGQSIEIQSCNGGGYGDVPGNHLRLLVYVDAIDFGSCFYRTSLRVPHSLGVANVW